MSTIARIIRLLVASTALPVALGLIAAAGSSGRGPALPYLDRGACPFECCTYGRWRALGPVGLHKAMDAGSPIIGTLQRGEWIRADTGTVVTRSAGHVVVLRDYPADEFKSNKPLYLKPGAELFLLHYQGEGAYLAWFEGRLISLIPSSDFEGPSPTGEPAPPRLRVDSELDTEWWVHVERGDGTRGWTNASDSFEGADACGGPLSDGSEP